jgi:hypothetical protein
MGTQPLITWKGKESDERLFWCYRPADWSKQQEVRYFATTNGPALISAPSELGGNIFMAWKGITGDTRIWLAVFGNAWCDQRTLEAISAPSTAQRWLSIIIS